MYEHEKKELIEAINEIRKELGLEPYPLEHLETKDIEELKRFYSQYYQMREDYRKRLKEEKPKFKLSLKTGLLIGIPLVAILLIIIILPFGQIKEGIVGPVLPAKPTENKTTNETFVEIPVFESTISIYDFTIQSIFTDQTNNYVLIIQNNGTKEIVLQKMLIDGQDIAYKVLAGSYPPLKVGDAIYLQLQKQCDNSTHSIKIISENKTLERELQACQL